jgi:hypothetical protein
MNIIEQINNHKYLFLTEIGEPKENTLRIVVKEGKLQEPLKEANIEEDNKVIKLLVQNNQTVISDENCFTYEIVFEKYIAYLVRNESYADDVDSESFFDKFFGVCTASAFLDYLQLIIFPTEIYPGKSTHYGLHTFNYIVDIGSVYEPNIKILYSPKPFEK